MSLSAFGVRSAGCDAGHDGPDVPRPIRRTLDHTARADHVEGSRAAHRGRHPPNLQPGRSAAAPPAAGSDGDPPMPTASTARSLAYAACRRQSHSAMGTASHSSPTLPKESCGERTNGGRELCYLRVPLAPAGTPVGEASCVLSDPARAYMPLPLPLVALLPVGPELQHACESNAKPPKLVRS